VKANEWKEAFFIPMALRICGVIYTIDENNTVKGGNLSSGSGQRTEVDYTLTV
jgi:hypothetical protein